MVRFMIKVTATEFAKNFGRYKEHAQREPVAITSHGRTSGFFIASDEFAELQRLRALERRAYRVADLPRELADAIASSNMDPRHDHLNALLDDK